MNWIKYDYCNEETYPPEHDLVLCCFNNKHGGKYYTVSRYVSNDFPHHEENVFWCEIIKPKN